MGVGGTEVGASVEVETITIAVGKAAVGVAGVGGAVAAATGPLAAQAHSPSATTIHAHLVIAWIIAQNKPGQSGSFLTWGTIYECIPTNRRPGGCGA